MILPIDPGFQFAIGQLVSHRRYGYRGVIVARDASCQADDDWYQSNRTQPPRDRPWYHVLVDGATGQATYAAESSLQAAAAPAPITHPLLAQFFDGWNGSGYDRNDRQWPGWVG